MNEQGKLALRQLWTTAIGLLQTAAVIALLIVVTCSALRLVGVPLTIGPKLGVQEMAWCAIAYWALSGGRLA